MVRLTIEGKTLEVLDEEFEKIVEFQYTINNKFLPKEDRKIAKARLDTYLRLLKDRESDDKNEI